MTDHPQLLDIDDEVLELRTRLIIRASELYQQRRLALLNDNDEDAEFYRRQYEQALTGYRSLRGDGS